MLHGILANIIDNESTLVFHTAEKMVELVKLFANDDTRFDESSDRIAKNM